ncbi:IKI3 family-domain-containing protein [Geopyxis carbonaria]|nr:IKI3 family-domain-containing protein [Geopyxis carbonaria]
MQNLIQIQRNSFATTTPVGIDTNITSLAWDAVNDCVLSTSSSVNAPDIVQLSRIENDGNVKPITSWTDVEEYKICNLYQFSETDSVCVILASGNIILVEESPVVVTQIVGSVDAGISSASWSPDGDVLAIVTAAHSLLLMTRDFDLIKEVAFSHQDINTFKQVSVGWGKAETQFKGKHAKTMKDPTIQESVDVGNISQHDDGTVVTSWRGDGQYLAISSVEGGTRRVIRVFSREGVLDSVSEPVNGLEASLSWRPSGNLIAGIQRVPQRLDVVFFERNGLRHGEFTIQDTNSAENTGTKVNGIFWNCDSSVLAICLSDKVQLWCMQNYHWYLKQEIPMTPNLQGKAIFQWHPEIPLKFFIFAGNMEVSDKCGGVNKTQVTIHEFSTKTCSSSATSPDDHGMVAVVDGRQLQITPFRYANVPPPMSYCSIELTTVPIDVSFSPSGKRIAALQAHGIDLVNWNFQRKPSDTTPQSCLGAVKLDDQPLSRQIVFIGEDQLCVLGQDEKGGSVIYYLKFNNHGGIELDKLVHPNMNRPFMIIESFCQQNALLCQDYAGNFIKYDIIEETEEPVLDLQYPCPWMCTKLVISMSESGRLQVNERLVTPSCTSFCVADGFLIYTTAQHLIKFVHLKEDPQEIEIVQDTAVNDERCRSIERGARLVCVIPSKFGVVLQMPRGNLETIFPRALVLAGTRKNIQSRDYRAAFLACRDHRVDLNLLHDYMPQQFFECIETFVKQVKKIDYIDLFLSQLREEDVTQTMYPEIYGNGTTVAHRGTEKVNRICNSFINFLEHNLLDSHVQNVITAYVCKSPPENEAALRLIASLRGRQQYDGAVKHICFLSDVNKLYDTALGIYDLELALTIAQQAQKTLQDLNETRRKYTIDDFLGRFSRALKSLHAMGEDTFRESQQYIIAKDLYVEAFQLYRQESKKIEIITRDYATHLENNGMFQEAGFAYESLGELELAIAAYRKAGLWKECLYLASKANRQDICDLAKALAVELREAKDYQSAARVYLDYCTDVDEAVRLLCQGNCFDEAMRIAAVNQKPQLIEDIIDPALGKKFGQTMELFAECKMQLKSQTKRIIELQLKKVEDPLAYFDGTVEVDAPDNVSLAPTDGSTSASLFTRYTGHTLATAMTGVSRKSSKNRRKEERKRARGKKGSVYEEEYLHNSLRRLVERIEQSRADTQHLVECMFRRQMRENASAIQTQMQDLISQFDNCMGELPSNTIGPDGEDGIKLDFPTLKPFKGLSSL